MLEKKNSDLLMTMAYKYVTEGLLSSFFREETSIRIGKHIGHYCYPIVSHVLKRQSRKCNNIGDIVDLALSFGFLGINIKPIQIREEITDLLRILITIKPHTILEIGTAGGGTLFLFTRIASPDALIISVDQQNKDFAFPHWKKFLYESFSVNEQKLHFLRADSHDINTVTEVERTLNGSEIDFFFIDGDHSYEGVKGDFNMYSPYVKKGGIMAFHDIVFCDGAHDPKGIFAVNKFWREIRDGYNSLEIVREWNQGWGGIGILFK